MPVADLIRKHGTSLQTFYRWRKKHGGLEGGGLRRFRQFEQEDARLKILVADLTLDKRVPWKVLAKTA